jgi:PucR C-terminal helix-turn-helix domain/GGDEF-like domain
MDPAGGDPGLAQSLVGLSNFGLPARAASSLIKQRGDLARRLSEAAVAAIPAFSVSGNPELLPDLERHAGEHIAELLRLLGGGAVRDFEFVRAYARRRAAQRFPIEATLQAYRCMQPILSTWLRGGLGMPRARIDKQTFAAFAELVTQYTSSISIVFAAEYVAHTSVLAEAEGDRRTELLSILVGGYDESDARVARLLKRAGYLEQRLSFCVALAQSTDPLEMENPARAQRIADAMVECVAALSVRVLVGVRSNLVTAVFSDIRRASGWTAPQASLADRIKEQLLALGPAVVIGLSGDQPSTSLIPRGVHEATVALDFADVTERVVPFYALSIRRLLIHRGAEYVQSALPVWFGRLRDADAKSQGHLLKTLRALADADMNVQRAARGLRVHPNTIYARTQRINDVTGLDAHRYHDLTHLLLAVDCGRV